MPIEKKNIAFIIPTLSGGGAERVVGSLSMYLSEVFNVYIIVYKKTDQMYPYKGKIINLKLPYLPYYITYFNRLILKYFRIIKNKKLYDIDVSISFIAGPNIMNLLTRCKKKVIISVRDFKSEQKGIINKILNIFIKILYNKSDMIISISKGVSEDLYYNYKINKNIINTIYNPIRINEIQKRKKEKIEDMYKPIFEHPVIITSGRLVHVKCQWALIRAFSNLKGKIPDLHLVIIGKGPLRGYLSDLAESLGMRNSVHFLGFQENPFTFLNQSKIFVLPSLSEGFGNVIIEALACSIPVVSTDCPAGPREILTGRPTFDYHLTKIEYAQYGVLVPRFDPKSRSAKDPLTYQELLLSTAMERLITDEQMRTAYIQRSLQRAMDFDMERIGPQWVEAIRRASQ